MNKIDEIKSLISELNLASIAYHRDDNPIMSDKEYDEKYNMLQEHLLTLRKQNYRQLLRV